MRQPPVLASFIEIYYVLDYINTGEQLADIFTKPLNKSVFDKLRNKQMYSAKRTRLAWQPKCGSVEMEPWSSFGGMPIERDTQ